MSLPCVWRALLRSCADARKVSDLAERARRLEQEARGEHGWGSRLEEHEVRLQGLRAKLDGQEPPRGEEGRIALRESRSHTHSRLMAMFVVAGSYQQSRADHSCRNPFGRSESIIAASRLWLVRAPRGFPRIAGFAIERGGDPRTLPFPPSRTPTCAPPCTHPSAHAHRWIPASADEPCIEDSASTNLMWNLRQTIHGQLGRRQRRGVFRMLCFGRGVFGIGGHGASSVLKSATVGRRPGGVAILAAFTSREGTDKRSHFRAADHRGSMSCLLAGSVPRLGGTPASQRPMTWPL